MHTPGIVHRILTVFLLATSYLSAAGQGFNEVAFSKGIVINNTGFSNLGNGLSFYDFDKDGLDDLTYAITTDSIVFYRNNGSTFDRIEVIPNTTDAKQPTWVDYDNDGDADFMISKRSGGTRLYMNNGDFTFTDVTPSLGLPAIAGVHIYGYSWGDYDRDGWLDVFLCTYHPMEGYPNFLCHNNGDGTFTEVGFAAGVANEAGLTFQSTWNDFNQDGWPDLYVINEANIPNAMYYNNGDGTFTDVSVSTGAGIQIQSMTNSISDYDRDGDWDIYVSNGLPGNYLLRNDGGVFTNVASEAGVIVNSFCWSALWLDHDHDTWDDLHVCTATNVLNQDWFFLNDGDGTFTNAMYPQFSNDYTYTYATARGDSNNDGFWDFSVTKVGPDYYQLFESIPTENHWLKLGLQGTWSNRDAIGTLLEYYIGGEHFMEYTRCGEQYLSQNSQYMILSLGEATSVDSLVITWPRGLVERYYSVAADQFVSYVEGDATIASIGVSGNPFICGDQGVSLNAGEWASYLWDSGEETASILAMEAGEYGVTVTDESGYSTYASIVVEAGVLPEVSASVQHPLCPGTTDGTIDVLLANSELVSITWNTPGLEGAQVEGLGAGDYLFEVTNQFGCSAVGSATLIDPVQLSAEVSTTGVLCYGGSDGTVSITTFGGTPDIVVDWTGLDPGALVAGTYVVAITDANGCSITTTFVIEQPAFLSLTIDVTDANNGPNGSATAEVTGGVEPYDYAWSSGSEDAVADGLAQGNYTLTVTDANGCVIEGSAAIIDVRIDESDRTALQLFPNPARGEVRLLAGGIMEEVVITAADGRMVHAVRPLSTQSVVPLTGMASGVYVVRVRVAGTWNETVLVVE